MVRWTVWGLFAAGLAAAAAQAEAPQPARVLPPAERAVIDLYKNLSPSVVSVANKAILSDWFGWALYEVPQGVGSGFVWDRKGHIVSNFHVIYRASTILITLRDGTQYEAKVVGADPDHDVAVLKIDAPPEKLTPIEVGQSHDLEVGQTVMAIGNPFGLDTSLSVGIVSALGRRIESMTGRQIFDVIQTDAAINPGNSGGPLLDSAGRLVGINTAIVSTSGSYAGVGFAVPVDTVRRVVPQLIASGRVERASMGLQTVPDEYLRRAGVEGVGVLTVIPGGPAAKGGLRGVSRTRRGDVLLGDVLVEAAGTLLRAADDLAAVLDRAKGGDKVRVVFLRDGERRTVELELQSQSP
jgi:S1-C subfamily serine protease